MGVLHNRSRHGVAIASMLVCLGAALLCDAYITFIAVRLPLPGDVAAPGAPWPLPQRWVNSTSVKTLNPDTIQFVSNADSCDVIVDAFARYKAILRLDASATADAGLPGISVVNVVIQDTACGNPDEFMNENHTITIGTGTTANIRANSIWGALRGLETFSQLLYISEANTYHINETAIADWPRFAYRGLMIDTARHFLTVNTIKNIMDGMSYDKLNVLHWHIVDDQSFPFELRSFPNMTTFGAYSPYHTYNALVVAELIQYARLRGIRIIPEFDTPGHTWSWGQALPKLITPCWGEGLQGGPYVPNYPLHGPAEILNPIQDYTYNVLAAIYADITNTFPGSYVHLGLDEAYYACWQSNPNITAWMAMMGYTTYAQVETYYQLKLIQIVRGILSNRFIIWQDPIDHDADVERDAIVEIWKDASASNPVTWEEYMLNITKKGYSTILSAPWYLNYISYGQDWRTYYLEDPLQFTNDTSLHSLVLGGEACMWAEYIDGGNILSTLWHRLSAVSERLWSDASVRDADSAAYRLDQHRCRYVRRGIPAKPVLPGYCGNYEWENL